MAPSELGIENVALVAIGGTEMLPEFGNAVKLILWHVLRHPVAAVIGEVQLLIHRIPVETNRVANAKRDYFGTGAIKIDAADLAMVFVMQHVVARLPDLQIKLIVRTNRAKLPAIPLLLLPVITHH